MPQVQRVALVRVSRAVPEVEALLEARFGAPREDDGSWTCVVPSDPTAGGALSIRVRPAADNEDQPGDQPATEIELEATTELDLPFFGGIVESLVGVHYER